MLRYSLEAPRRGTSNEYPQHMFLSRNKKTTYLIPLLSKLTFQKDENTGRCSSISPPACDHTDKIQVFVVRIIIGTINNPYLKQENFELSEYNKTLKGLIMEQYLSKLGIIFLT